MNEELEQARLQTEVLLSSYIKKLRAKGIPERRIKRLIKKKFNITVK